MKNLFGKSLILLILMIASLTLNAQDQSENEDGKLYEPMKLSGPRAGITYIGGQQGRRMAEYGINQYFSQFGWQFETRYFTTKDGFQGLIETVVLLGAFETEEPTLSGTLLVGFRTRNGFEAGCGPSVSTAAGGAFIIAIGHTAKTEYVNIPVNFAVAPSSDAIKYTFLVGFNIRRH